MLSLTMTETAEGSSVVDKILTLTLDTDTDQLDTGHFVLMRSLVSPLTTIGSGLLLDYL